MIPRLTRLQRAARETYRLFPFVGAVADFLPYRTNDEHICLGMQFGS